MKQLMVIALLLAVAFASTFVLINVTGMIAIEDIRRLLSGAAEVDPLYVAACISVLLLADIFIAIPTLTVALLAGHFTGFTMGGISAATGMMAAGVVGYIISWRYGSSLLVRIYKDPRKIEEMQRIFSEHGIVALLICRAMPILPEVCCCLAGANRMPFRTFIVCYGVGTVPYAFIAAYAGSQSSLVDPKPAIFAAIGLSLALWLSWLVFIRKIHGKHDLREPAQEV